MTEVTPAVAPYDGTFLITDGTTTWHTGQGPCLVYLAYTPSGRPIVRRLDDPQQWNHGEVDLPPREKSLIRALVGYVQTSIGESDE